MTQAKTWTLEELKALLIEYDRQNGSYPEHAYEGFAAWLWLTGRYEDGSAWDETEEWLKEVEGK